MDQPKDARGRRAELRALDRMGFKPTKASGALADKGDGTRGWFRKEVKTTEAASLSVKLAWLQKIAREAVHTAVKPVLAVVFVDGSGRPRRDGAWVMLRERDWKEVLDALDDQEQPTP